MGILPYYVLFGFGVGLVIILFIQNIRLALRLLLTLGKVAIVLVVIALAGALLGVWELPREAGVVSLRIERIWEPLQRLVLRWFRGLFR